MNQDVILRVGSKLLLPFMLVFALYVQFHGDFGPGGGFQAGVIAAAMIILYSLIFGLASAQRIVPLRLVEVMIPLGVLLYAGTGVLGLEAVSRGAASAVLVERDAVLVERLAALRTRLDAGAAVTVVRDDAEHWLTSPARPFDVVFLDPPFAAGVTAALLERLAQGWLAPRALVYLEQAIDAPDPPSPWCVRKAGHTRHVSYKLLDRSG